MQFASILSMLSAVTLGSSAAVESRIPRLGGFGVSTTFGCPLVNQEVTEFALGQQNEACRNFYNNTTYAAINVYYWEPKCLLTVFNTYDCSDSGIVSGTGCWSPPGGISAFKVTCPYL